MPVPVGKAREDLKVLYEKHGCVHMRSGNRGVELRLTVHSAPELDEAVEMLKRLEVRHGVVYWKRPSGASVERVIPIYKRGSITRFLQEVKPLGYERTLMALQVGEAPHKRKNDVQ